MSCWLSQTPHLKANVKPAGGTATHTRRKINVGQGTGSILGSMPRFSILFWTDFIFPFRLDTLLGAAAAVVVSDMVQVGGLKGAAGGG